MSANTHFAIFTALPVEFKALVARLDSARALSDIPGATTGFVKRRGVDGRHQVTVVELQRGNLDTAAAAPDLLTQLGVEAAFFCGIATSLKDDVGPSDVVAGLRIIAYGIVKEEATQKTRRRTLD